MGKPMASRCRPAVRSVGDPGDGHMFSAQSSHVTAAVAGATRALERELDLQFTRPL